MKLVRHIWPVLTIVLFAGIAYHNSFQGVFIFDDFREILENEKIRSLHLPWGFMWNTRRPFLYLTLAVNHALGGYDPFGYHLFNLSVHAAAGVALFLLLKRTAEWTRFRGCPVSRRELTCLVITLIWLVHPLQTQAVTYLIQRAESLTTMLYFLTLLFSREYFVSNRTGWAIGAGIACLAGGLTKEVMFTAPFLVLLYDRAFVSSSFGAAVKKHGRLYGLLFVTCAVMLCLWAVTRPEKIPSAGFEFQDISPARYLVNQSAVIVHYMKLILWPALQVFDYEWLPAAHWNALLPFIIYIFLLIVYFLWSFRRDPLTGFLGLGFFIVLLPSSSFIPIKDLAVEHRLYLASVFLIVLVSLGLKVLLGAFIPRPRLRDRTFLLSSALIIVVLTGMTVRRNRDYHDEFGMWRDVLQKRPLNSRAQNNVGKFILNAGDAGASIPYFEKAIQLKRDYPDVHLNLGYAYMQTGDFETARRYFRQALELEPRFGMAYNNLGTILQKEKKYAESVPYFKKAIESGFIEPGVYNNLAASYYNAGHVREALETLDEAVAKYPGDAKNAELLDYIRGKFSDKP